MHYDDVPSHTNIIIRQYLIKNEVNTISPAPYWLDLAPCHFLLFPPFNLRLCGHRYESMKARKDSTLTAFKATQETEYKNYFEDWKKHWNKCVFWWKGISLKETQ